MNLTDLLLPETWYYSFMFNFDTTSFEIREPFYYNKVISFKRTLYSFFKVTKKENTSVAIPELQNVITQDLIYFEPTYLLRYTDQTSEKSKLVKINDLGEVKPIAKAEGISYKYIADLEN